MPEIPVTNESDNPTSRSVSVLSSNFVGSGLSWAIEYICYLMTRGNSSGSHITSDPLKYNCNYMTSVSDLSAAYETIICHTGCDME